MYNCHACLSVCLSVCLSAAVYPHYCTDPDVSWGWYGVPPSCALLGGFAISARVSLLRQHSAARIDNRRPHMTSYRRKRRTRNVSEYLLVLITEQLADVASGSYYGRPMEYGRPLFMVALCNRETIYIFMLWFVLLSSSSSFFISSPNLSRRRLDVCHTSTHGVALVRI